MSVGDGGRSGGRAGMYVTLCTMTGYDRAGAVSKASG